MVSPDLLHYNIYNTIMNTSIKHPRMVNPGQDFIFIRQDTAQGGIEVHSADAFVEIDTKAARESLGFGHMFDGTMVKYFADKGKQSIADLTRQIVNDGDAMVKYRTSPVQLAKQHFLEDRKVEPSQAQLTFIPSEDADINVREGYVDINYDPTDLNISWANTGIVPYQLDRGTVTFDIVQKAYIDMLYMGDPIYFPAEAEPVWSVKA